jgi:hypothetical protein
LLIETLRLGLCGFSNRPSSIRNQTNQRFSLTGVPWRHNIFYLHSIHKKCRRHRKLFDTLYNSPKMAPEECPACGGTRELRVHLDFQLGAGDGDFKVISALLPSKLESCPAKRKKKSPSTGF